MRRILIFDTILPIGHKDLYNKLIGLFPHNIKLIVLNSNNFYDKVNEDNLNYKTVTYLSKKRNQILNQIIQLINTIVGYFSVSSFEYDTVFFTTFDTLNIVISRFLFRKKKIYLLHHNNTDQIQNRYKKKFFNTYKNKVTHIVFADFIKQYLIQMGVNESNICVLTHPLASHIEVSGINIDVDKKEYIGLGYANDENLIQQIIDYENQTGILAENDISLVLRSRIQPPSENSTIRIINGHLKREEYESLYERAKAVLLLYSDKYQNRFSGVILDSFRHRKKVLGINIPVVKHFSHLYPNNCMLFQTIEDLFEKLRILDKVFFSQTEYDIFLQEHSDEKIKKEIIAIFSLK